MVLKENLLPFERPILGLAKVMGWGWGDVPGRDVHKPLGSVHGVFP